MSMTIGVGAAEAGEPAFPAAEDCIADKAYRSRDRIREALTTQVTGGLSPASLALAFMDWSIRLASAPGKYTELAVKASRKAAWLAGGSFMVDGRPAAIQNIRVPIFAVGTERDHVAPWRSVYKIHQLADTDVTFVLTSGGHNAGIVSELGHPHRHFRAWLVSHSSPDRVPPPAMGAPEKAMRRSWMRLAPTFFKGESHDG